MIYILLALGCSAVGILPLLFARKVSTAIRTGITAAAVLSLIFIWLTPSFNVWPLFGTCGILTVMLWGISALIDHISDGLSTSALWPILGLMLYLVSCLSGCDMFRANEYAALIGDIKQGGEWTQDIQPKDPNNMKMANTANSMYRAGNAPGIAGTAIGSQFHFVEEDMTLQMLQKSPNSTQQGLVSVVPLDFSGFWQWVNTSCAPGYITVDAEDQLKEAQYIALPEDQRICYSPNAYWAHNLERHLRLNGYINVGFVRHTFQIDPTGKPWWVVSTFEPTIAWWGEKVTGILLVDPHSGAIKDEPLDKLDPWIKRVIPEEYVKDYLDQWGKYSSGFWNNGVGGKYNLTEPEDPHMIYGTGDEAEWVTGMIAKNNNNSGDDKTAEQKRSLVYLMYTDTRTGKTTRYITKGGRSDKAIIDAVDANGLVKQRTLHAIVPQIYNINGTMAAVCPLLNSINAFSGVAVVDIKNSQIVAPGDDALQAVNLYKSMIGESGRTTSLENERNKLPFNGTLDRFRPEVVNGKTTYYFTLPGTPHIFMVAAERSAALKVAQHGDVVSGFGFKTDEDIITVTEFNDSSVPLVTSKNQDTVRAIGQDDQSGQATKEAGHTIRQKLQNMSDEDLQKLERSIKK